MSESSLQTQLKTLLLTSTANFSTGDVVVNDWSVLDGSSAKVPNRFASRAIADKTKPTRRNKVI